jgi:hypothetical protein
MLRPFETYQATINRNQGNNKNPQLGYWLITNLKNKKFLLSNIWIPNLLYADLSCNSGILNSNIRTHFICYSKY